MRRIGIAFVLGALTTVAVAWLLAAFLPVPMYPRRVGRAWMASNGSLWTASEVRPFGVHDVWWLEVDEDPTVTREAQLAALRESYRSMEAERRGTSERLRASDDPPRWGTLAGGRDGPAATIGSDTAFGWPLPCLWYSVRSGTMSTNSGIALVGEKLVGGYRVRGTPSARARPFGALPLLPLWAGLALDTLLWSLAWLVALSLPAAARRRWRLRRGRCWSCGYALSGLSPGPGGRTVCPECGIAVEPGQRARAERRGAQ